MDPLALQPSLHVGERDDDGVDRRRPRSSARSSLDGQRAVVSVMSSPCPVRSAQQSAQQRGGGVAVLLHRRPGRGRRRRRGWPRRRRRAGRWSARCCAAAPGSRVSMLVQRGLRPGDGLDEHRRARTGSRSRGEAASRRAGGRRRRRPPRPRAGTLEQPGPLVAGQRPACAASARRARLDDPAEVQGVEQRRTRCATDVPVTPGLGLAGVGDDRAAAASPAGRDEARVAQRGDGLAQRVAADAEPLGELTLGRQLLAVGEARRAGSPWRAARRWPRRRCRDAGRSTASGNAVSATVAPTPRTASMSAEDLRGRLGVVPLRDVTHEVVAGHRRTRSPSRRRARPAPRSARS